MQEAFLYEALRTPIGSGHREGALYEVKSVDLLAIILKALSEKHDLERLPPDDLLVGCVTPIGDQGFNLARAALLQAGWPASVSGMILQRFAASGLEAVNFAAVKVRAGAGRFFVAGGVESQSRVPAGSDGGALIHDPSLINNLSYLPEGVAADLLATLEGYSREELDDYAWRSLEQSLAWRDMDSSASLLTPILDPNGLVLLDRDEAFASFPGREELAAMEPSFTPSERDGFDAMAIRKYPGLNKIEHRHTPGNSADRADGAALILVGNREAGEALGLEPKARVISMGNACGDPTLMLTGAVPAARQALERAGIAPEGVDVWCCHEPFAAVALHFQRSFNLGDEAFNPDGGAIALGQPLGASGAILLGSLLGQLERRGAETGLAAIGGGGMGVATLIQRL